MIWNFENLRGCTLHATDGSIGSITDLYFEDVGWKVRYLVVDTGGWLPGRKVLIVPQAVGAPDPDVKAIPTTLSKEEVRTSPDIDTDRPVSRPEEEALHGHFGWMPYWPAAESPRTGLPPDVAAPHGDPHLRSVQEMEGYHIAAEDGEIGHIESFLIDIPDAAGSSEVHSRGGGPWAVRYLVVDARDWMPGRAVLIAPGWVRRIDWVTCQVAVEVSREKVRHAPTYDTLNGIERGFEDRLYDHYGRAPHQ